MAGIVTSPFLQYPPIDDRVFNAEGSLSESWSQWLHTITDANGHAVAHVFLPDGAGAKLMKRQIAMTKAIQISGVDRDKLEGVPNGAYIYNTTTNRMNFFENGSWVTFAPVAA